MSNGPTEADVIRERQANCRHAFAKGVSDREAQCVHCGLPESAYSAPLSYTWNGIGLAYGD